MGEASRLTGCAKPTLRKLIESGELKADKIQIPWGGRFIESYAIYASSLETLIEEKLKTQPKATLEELEERIAALEDFMDDVLQELAELKEKLRQSDNAE